MKVLLDPALENQSSEEVFRFQLRCGVCGSRYTSKAMPFSKAGVEPETAEKRILYRAIYEQEFRCARQSALDEAAEHFNCCPICGRIVCNRCFLICDDLDMCRDCAERLKETGSPVLADRNMTVV